MERPWRRLDRRHGSNSASNSLYSGCTRKVVLLVASKLAPGERAPDFILPSGGTPTRFYGRAGGVPTALVFPPLDGEEAAAVLVAALGGLSTIVVARRKPQGELGALVFVDEDGKVSEAYGVPEAKGWIVVLDPNLRVLRTIEYGAQSFAPALASSVLQAVSELPELEARTLSAQAPVLLVPRVLEPEVCSTLMDVWARHGNEETGVEASESNGRANVVRSELKRRRDHTVRDECLMKMLVQTLGRRVIPEVHRVFSYPVTRFEGFKIVRYDAASGGFFRAHRDNLSPTTAHRRFALTLNLKDDYDGGELRFPEYGPMKYRPAAGEALLFSCSLLHEVTEVTAGERFALLSFLFGERDVRL